MKERMYLLLFFLCFSCLQAPEKTEVKESTPYQDSHWRHLAYVLQLKNEVAQRTWKEFTRKDFYHPAIYHTYRGAFVLNPNEHISRLTDHQEMKPIDRVETIRLSEKYTDTTTFDFSVSYSDTDSTALYFRDNVLSFQSFALTEKLIGVSDLQDWSIMVIHELFHGYQRSIPGFKAYYTALEIPGGPDEYLAKYHRELDWFKESIKAENQALKDIWIHGADLAAKLTTYDSLRTSRIERIKAEFGLDIREVEDYEICTEGHARYFESLCKRYLSRNELDTSMLTEADRSLISGMFAEYQIKKDKGLYDIYNDRYYYQLGYNISMILEQYLPEYQKTLYREENNFNRYLEELKAIEE